MSDKSEKTETETQAAINAGLQLGSTLGRITEIGGVPVAIIPGSMKMELMDKLLDLQDQRAGAPRRLRGTAVHKELESFIAHVNRQKDSSSVIWADPEKCTLVTILNYHMPSSGGAPGQPRWGDHRALYTCPWSTQWKLWAGVNEKWMSQETFGQLVEDNMGDLANPDPELETDKDMPTPAKVLEVARHLVVYARHNFERKINVSDGTGTFTWKKDNEVEGSTKVPKGFLLGIPVFDAGEVYRLPVRLRYQVEGGAAKFQISLHQPQVVVRDAFDHVRTEAAAGTALPLFVGSPE